MEHDQFIGTQSSTSRSTREKVRLNPSRIKIKASTAKGEAEKYCDYPPVWPRLIRLQIWRPECMGWQHTHNTHTLLWEKGLFRVSDLGRYVVVVTSSAAYWIRYQSQRLKTSSNYHYLFSEYICAIRTSGCNNHVPVYFSFVRIA